MFATSAAESPPSVKPTALIMIRTGKILNDNLPTKTYVVTSLDDRVINKTPDSSIPLKWNAVFQQPLETLTPDVKSVFTFSMYKKRWSVPGYKLIGNRFIIYSFRYLRSYEHA